MKRNLLMFLVVLLSSSSGVTGCALLNSSHEESELSQRYRTLSSTPTDVRLGMSPKDVESAWGEPRSVEYAGSRESGNERWSYAESPTSRFGIGANRVIYFEEGRVVGWETQAGTR